MWGKWLILSLAVLGTIVLLSLLCWAWLVAAAKRIRRKEAKQDSAGILAALPKTDCGICGMETCRLFAEQAANEQAFSLTCPFLREEDQQRFTQLFEQRKSERKTVKAK